LPGSNAEHLLLATATMSSLLIDFSVRVAPKSTIRTNTVLRLPLVPIDHPLSSSLASRALLLNSLSDAYTDLWNSSVGLTSDGESWAGAYGHQDSISMEVLDYEWSENSPLRLDADRRQAQVEIDALVALMLGVTADELCSIYRTQFPVLYKYDTQRDHFDQNGRLVPAEVLKTWQKLGEAATLDDLTAANAQGFTYTYAPPFATLDREADMRTAYAEFEQRLADREKRTSESAEGGASRASFSPRLRPAAPANHSPNTCGPPSPSPTPKCRQRSTNSSVTRSRASSKGPSFGPAPPSNRNQAAGTPSRSRRGSSNPTDIRRARSNG